MGCVSIGLAAHVTMLSEMSRFSGNSFRRGNCLEVTATDHAFELFAKSFRNVTRKHLHDSYRGGGQNNRTSIERTCLRYQGF